MSYPDLNSASSLFRSLTAYTHKWELQVYWWLSGEPGVTCLIAAKWLTRDPHTDRKAKALKPTWILPDFSPLLCSSSLFIAHKNKTPNKRKQGRERGESADLPNLMLFFPCRLKRWSAEGKLKKEPQSRGKLLVLKSVYWMLLKSLADANAVSIEPH